MEDEKKQRRLNKLLSAMDETSMTQEEFFRHFKMVLDIFIAMKNTNQKQITEMNTSLNAAMSEMRQMTGEKMTEMKQRVMVYCEKEMSKMFKEQENGLNFIRDKVKEIKDGKDADEEKIVQNVLNQIKLPEQKETILDSPEEIRDKLETLEGDSRLEIKAIKNLRDELDALKKQSSQTRIIGGGTSQISVAMALTNLIIDAETHGGTIDGVLKDFTIARTPSPLTSLKIYRGGARQKITEDYSFSGVTISFTNAPQVGEVILVEYRV